MATVTIQDIAQRRKEIAEMEEQIAASEQTEQVKEYLALLESKKEVTKALKQEESNYRADAAQRCKANNLTEYAGGKYKKFKIVEYDEEKAIEWAITRQLDQLYSIETVLNKKKFEGVAEALQLHFVTFSEEGRFQIDSDLSKFLEDEGIQDEQQ